MPTRRNALAAGLALLTVAALTACGTTRPAAQSTTASAASAITVTDGRGKQVRLEAPAKRVVATEWDSIEGLVSLGVMPVGVADVAGYSEWDTVEPLAKGVTDVGDRGEPSVDAIAKLTPDLIVTSTDLSASVIAQYERVAPTIVVKSGDAADQVGQMKSNLRLLATATGTTAKGAANIAAYDAAVADGKAALAKAGLSGTPFAFADGYKEGDQVTVRPFTTGSLIGTIVGNLGLKNAWSMKGDDVYGLASTDVEGLTKLPDEVQFAYISNAQDGGDPFNGALGNNAVWKGLPFVEQQRVHHLPDGIWQFGSTASMTKVVQQFVDDLTA